MSSEEEDTNDTKGDGGKKPNPRRRPGQEQCPHRSGVTTLPRRDELSQTEFSRLLAKKQGRIWYADPPRRRRNEVEYRRFRLDPVEEEPQEQSTKTIHVWKVAAASSLKSEKATLITPSKIEDSNTGANISLSLETSLKKLRPVVEYKSQQVDTRDFNFMDTSCDDISLVSTTGEDTEFEGIVTSRPMTPMETTEISIPENVENELNASTQIKILEEEKPPTQYRMRAQESGPQIRPLNVQNTMNRSIDTEEILPMEARSASRNETERERHVNRIETKQRRCSQAEGNLTLCENSGALYSVERTNLSDTEPQIFAKDEEMSRKHMRVSSTMKHSLKKRIHEIQNTDVVKETTSAEKTIALSHDSKKHKSEIQNMSKVLQDKQTKEIKSHNRENQCIPNLTNTLDGKSVIHSANCDKKSKISKNIQEIEEKIKNNNNSTDHKPIVINTCHSIKETQSRLTSLSKNQTKERKKTAVICENEFSLPTNSDGKSVLNSAICEVKTSDNEKLGKVTKNERKHLNDNKKFNELTPATNSLDKNIKNNNNNEEQEGNQYILDVRRDKMLEINVGLQEKIVKSVEKTSVPPNKSTKQKLILGKDNEMKGGNSEVNGKNEVISSLTDSLDETVVIAPDCDISSFGNVKLKETKRNSKDTINSKQLHNNEENVAKEDEKLGENVTGKTIESSDKTVKHKSLVAVESTKKIDKPAVCGISSFDNVKLKETKRNSKDTINSKQLHNNEENVAKEDEKLGENVSGKIIESSDKTVKHKSLVAVESTKKIDKPAVCGISSCDIVKLKETKRNLKDTINSKQLHKNGENVAKEDEKLGENVSGKTIESSDKTVKHKSLVAVESTKKIDKPAVCGISSCDNVKLKETKRNSKDTINSKQLHNNEERTNHEKNVAKEDEKLGENVSDKTVKHKSLVAVESTKKIDKPAVCGISSCDNVKLKETKRNSKDTINSKQLHNNEERTNHEENVAKENENLGENVPGKTVESSDKTLKHKSLVAVDSTQEIDVTTVLQENLSTSDVNRQNICKTLDGKSVVNSAGCDLSSFDDSRLEECNRNLENTEKRIRKNIFNDVDLYESSQSEEDPKLVKLTEKSEDILVTKCLAKTELVPSPSHSAREHVGEILRTLVNLDIVKQQNTVKSNKKDDPIKKEKRKELPKETSKKIETTIEEAVATEKLSKVKNIKSNNENGTFYVKTCLQKGLCSFPDSNVNREEELKILNETINKIVKASARTEIPFPATEYNVYNTSILNKISKDSINAKVSKKDQKVTLKSHGFIKTNNKKKLKTIQKEESVTETFKKITEEKLPSKQMFDTKTKTIREINSSDSAKSSQDLKLSEVKNTLESVTVERVIRPVETEPSNGPIRKQLIKEWFKNANDIIGSRVAASSSNTKPKTLTPTGSASSGETQPKKEDNLTSSMVIKKPGISVESLPLQSEKVNLPSLNIKVSEKDRRELFNPRGLAKEIMFLLKVILVANDYIITRDPRGSMSIERAPQSDSDEMLTPEDSDVDVVTRRQK